MEREVGGGIGIGNTCKPLAVSFQCMTKSTTNKKKKKKKKEGMWVGIGPGPNLQRTWVNTRGKLTLPEDGWCVGTCPGCPRGYLDLGVTVAGYGEPGFSLFQAPPHL